METRVLDFQDKLEVLTLDELKKSIKAKEVSGYSKILPVEHYTLWEDIAEKLDKRNLNFQFNNIYAAGGKNARRIEAVEKHVGEKALEATWLQKLIGSIEIKDGANDETSTTIGIAFHDRGIQVSYGQNVHVCSNFSIMNASNTIKTFGTHKIDNYGNFMQIIDSWAATHEHKRNEDLHVIKVMEELSIDEATIMPSIIGKLQIKAVQASYLGGDQAPFNIGQVSTFTKNYLKSANDNKVKNLWDLYNNGTNIMKPEVVDIATLHPQTISFTEFLKEEFELNKN